MSNSPAVRLISECFITPKHQLEDHKSPIYLSSWDLALLSGHYIQTGLLYSNNESQSTSSDIGMGIFLDQMKDTLSLTLVHFHLLAGQLQTHHLFDEKDGGHTTSLIFIDPTKGPGARFIHAVIDLSISDLLTPMDIPRNVVYSLFDHHLAANHDGHDQSLLTIQVTQLLDGIFIGFSMNHVCADGTSFWHFINSWSEIFKKKFNKEVTDHHHLIPQISRPPIHTRWFMDGSGPALKLPYSNPDEFISRFEAPLMRERIFRFSAETIRELKSKANSECANNNISSFQSLTALVWRCVTRSRRLTPDEPVTCTLAINNRGRLNPPLSDDYFGNILYAVKATTTAGELLSQSFGWAALMVNRAVTDHTNKVVSEFVEGWLRNPVVYQTGKSFSGFNVHMGSSPRFNMYGNEFGKLGKPVAVLSGHGTKFDGKVTSYPGRDGCGSIDLEICLLPDYMSALETDQEFMTVVS